MALIQYVATVDDPQEVVDYLHAYLSSSPAVTSFAEDFVQQRTAYLVRARSTSAQVICTLFLY